MDKLVKGFALGTAASLLLPDKVQALVNGSSIEDPMISNSATKVAAENEEETMTKVASAHTPDKRDMFNATRNHYGVLTPAKPTDAKEVMLEKMAAAIGEVEKKYNEAERAMHTYADMAADALLKYAQLGNDLQTVFNKSAQLSDMSKDAQHCVEHAYAMKVKSHKANGRLPSFSLKFSRMLRSLLRMIIPWGSIRF